MKENTTKSSGLRILRTALPEDSSRLSAKKSEVKNDEQFLKILQQDSQQLTIVLSDNGMIKYCNEAITPLLGYNSTRVLGQNFRRLIPVQQWVAFSAALRASEEENELNKSIYIDCQFLDKEEKKHHFSLSVRDQRHQPLVEGYIIHAQRINRLKRQEEKLKLRNLAIELIKEAVVIISPETPSIVFANQAFFDLSGFTKKEIYGGQLNLFKSPYKEMLFNDRTDPKQIEKFAKAIKSNTKFEGRIFSKKKNGKIFYNRFSLTPVFDSERLISHYIVSMKEIRQRKKNS